MNERKQQRKAEGEALWIALLCSLVNSTQGLYKVDGNKVVARTENKVKIEMAEFSKSKNSIT